MVGETQKARIGWGGEFWLSSDDTAANLNEMVQVVSFGLPEDKVDEVETTHLKSPNKRREFIGGLIDGGEVDVVLNYRPGSDTDIAARDALRSGTTRACLFVVPDEEGIPEWQVATSGIVKGYSRGEVVADGKLEATLTLKVTGDSTEGAYVPPVGTRSTKTTASKAAA